MNHCLYCYDRFIEKTSWSAFLGLSAKPVLCYECEKKLEWITGDLCEICGRLFKDEDTYREGERCLDCIKWEKNKEWKGLLRKNRSLYTYNSFLKDVIYRFKYRGDAELSKIFTMSFKRIYYREFSKHIIIPIPLSKERLYERGFNQAELVAKNFGEPVLALKRVIHEDKQSKKSRQERLRLQASNPFVLESSLNKRIKYNDIIIVDDIYTTGVTVRQAAQVLKQAGAKSISSLTIAR